MFLFDAGVGVLVKMHDIWAGVQLRAEMFVALTTVLLVVTWVRHHYMGDPKPVAWGFWLNSWAMYLTIVLIGRLLP